MYNFIHAAPWGKATPKVFEEDRGWFLNIPMAAESRQGGSRATSRWELTFADLIRYACRINRTFVQGAERRTNGCQACAFTDSVPIPGHRARHA